MKHSRTAKRIQRAVTLALGVVVVSSLLVAVWPYLIWGDSDNGVQLYIPPKYL